MPERPGVPCPLCGEELPREAESCPNCGATVSEPALRGLMRALGIDSAKASELARSGVRSPADLGGRSVDDVLRAPSSAVLYLCTECGAFVSSADKVCGRCGAVLEEEAPDLETFLKGEETKACPACGETVPAVALVCPACGSFIPEDSTTCPKCGVEFEKDMAKCSNCQAWIPVDVKQCPECGVEF